LRHFATEGWLRVLDFITTGRGVLVPESVERELIEQSHTIGTLGEVLDADWITFDRSDALLETMAFARYEQRLVANGKNRGECGVLALGETPHATMRLVGLPLDDVDVPVGVERGDEFVALARRALRERGRAGEVEPDALEVMRQSGQGRPPENRACSVAVL
jgi:hypothetical protein